jgi:nitrite reductase (cytochrome c-552)
MSAEPNPQPRSRAWLWYSLTVVGAAGATFLVMLLLMNISRRKAEGEQHHFKVVDIAPDTIDPEVWGRNFPSQYRTYLLTADQTRTRHGGSDGHPPSRLESDQRLIRLFDGYPFSKDFREKRGHAYMLVDQKQTERVKQFKQPGACLHCHASAVPAYRKAGDGDVMAGFKKVCAMPIQEAWKLAEHPVACIDCHNEKTMALRVERPAFIEGIRALAASNAEVPHLPSIRRWRESKSKEPYDINTMASRQEMRSFVCGQCHVEYYFQGEGKVVTYPWIRGLKADEIEQYYDEDKQGYKDYVHGETKAPILKAQHPEFETWSQGIHARSGVACADCHMPYVREGAVKVSDHQVRSPMLQINRACQTCHRYPETEIEDRVRIIQKRTMTLMGQAEDAVLALMDAVKEARAKGAKDEALADALKKHRQAQWRVDFVNAENSRGFHAPQETARLLGEAIDFARQGEVSAVRAGAAVK